MSQLPINPLSPEQQQKIMGQMYLLMGKQVQSYHKHRHMGNNSSVPVELAQDLMESIEYTVNQVGGLFAHPNAEEALKLGQAILEDKVSKAKTMLDLANGTAPHWQTECRWEALRYLHHYLDTYDPQHLAHKGPDNLFYPILISLPEGIQGIDCCLFYLNILWFENQIMAGIPDDTLDQFWDYLPTATLNQCESLLINGIGKALIGSKIDPLVFDPDEHMQLIVAMTKAHEDALYSAADLLCQWLNLKDENARRYVFAIIPQLSMWIGSKLNIQNIGNLFICSALKRVY